MQTVKIVKTFNQYLKEEEEVNLTLEEEIVDFILYSEVMVAQFHLFHLLTKNGTHHSALKEFYEGLQDDIDAFAEYCISKFGLEDLSYMKTDTDLVEFDYNDELVIETLSKYRGLVVSVADNFKADTDTSSMYNELTKIIELCDGLLYKLDME